MKENPLVQQDFFSIEFVCWTCSLIGVGCRSRGRMPVTITCSFGAFSCSFKPQAMTPSAMSCGLLLCMLLVPHNKTATRRDCGRERCPTLQRRCSMESPPIPQLTVLKGFRWAFHTAGYRANPSTIESPKIVTRACCLIILFTNLR